MRDTSIEVRRTEYNRRSQPRINFRHVRVFRHTPERVELQLLTEKHYMTASLDATQIAEIVNALQEGLQEVEAQIRAREGVS